jgi:hypothetical protein
MGMTEYIFIAAFFGVPAIAGGWLANCKGKNLFLWVPLSLLFPFLVLVLWLQKPDHEVTGHYRKCRSCGEIYPWKLSACRYCGADKTT